MLLQALARRRPVGVGLGKGWRPVQHSSLHAAQCAQVDRGAGMDCMDFLATRYTGGAGPVWTPPSRTMHTGADFDGDMGTPLPPGGVGTKVIVLESHASFPHTICTPTFPTFPHLPFSTRPPRARAHTATQPHCHSCASVGGRGEGV